MKSTRILSLILAIILLLPAFATFTSADADWAEFLDFEGAPEPVPEDNLLKNTSFDDSACLQAWNVNDNKATHISKPNGGYLLFSEITHATIPYDFSHTSTVIPAGTYKFTGYFRMAYEGEVTELRFYLYDNDAEHSNKTANGASKTFIYPTHDEWLKVEFYIELDSDFAGLRINGGPKPAFTQSYCIDNFSLVKVDSIPEGYVRPESFGTPVTAQQATDSNNGSIATYPKYDPELDKDYEVQGIIVNRDIDFLGTCQSAGTSVSKATLKKYAQSYKDTHVTDIMLNIFCQIIAYPSEVGTDFIDQYHYNKENGHKITANQEMAYLLFERKGLDYIKELCEAFTDLGINPWLSFRMNDAHNVQDPTTVKIWDFFNDNPEVRRVQHGSKVNTYYHNIFDYTYDKVRQYVLDIINESLGRYDCYGIELDFQREMWIWHHGGEYAGLDILNDFMRDVDVIVKSYESRYGHDIKVAVRCASDIQTNYDMGFDVITWAAEGLIDLINPTSRWATTDFEIPVREWTAVMHPFGVEVAPGMEILIQPHTGSKQANQTFETLCAGAANWFSQGADKVYLYNMFLGYNGITEEERITTSKNLSISTGGGHFNMLTTIGSYEKVLNRNRKLILSYNDIQPIWKMPVNRQIPLEIGANKTGSLMFPIGDVLEGSKVTVRFDANSTNLKQPPTVYINGHLAKHLENIYENNPYTTNNLMIYEVPEAALDDGILVVEITPQKYLSIKYADVHIEVPKN